MSFTRSTTTTDVHTNMPDYPSAEGYTTAQLKTAFDAPATGLKGDINRLEGELEDTSAASNIGATALADGDDSGNTVQDKLEKLQDELQGIALGDIPDGSITQAKLNGTYEATLAKKNGTLQTGLSAEMLNGKTEAQLKSSFLGTANPTTLNFTQTLVSATPTTETKTLNVTGDRYYMMTFSYNTLKFGLYDAKSQKFVFADGKNVDIALNSNNIKIQESSMSNGSATLNVTYSSNVLTFNLTKDTSSKYVQAGTITVFELGGMV